MSETEIKISGLRVFAHHGVYDWEQEEEQLFVIDIELTVPTPVEDGLSNTVDYSELLEEIADLTKFNRFKLIETLGARILDHVLAKPMVIRAKVTIHKPQAQLNVQCGDVAVVVEANK